MFRMNSFLLSFQLAAVASQRGSGCALLATALCLAVTLVLPGRWAGSLSSMGTTPPSLCSGPVCRGQTSPVWHIRRWPASLNVRGQQPSLARPDRSFRCCFQTALFLSSFSFLARRAAGRAVLLPPCFSRDCCRSPHLLLPAPLS